MTALAISLWSLFLRRFEAFKSDQREALGSVALAGHPHAIDR